MRASMAIAAISMLLVAIGLGVLAYAHWLYPGMAGPKRLTLTQDRGFKGSLTLKADIPVELIASSNESISVMVDGRVVGSGRRVAAVIGPGLYMLSLSSNSTAEVEVYFRPSYMSSMEAASIAMIGVGLMLVPVAVTARRRELKSG